VSWIYIYKLYCILYVYTYYHMWLYLIIIYQWVILFWICDICIYISMCIQSIWVYICGLNSKDNWSTMWFLATYQFGRHPQVEHRQRTVCLWAVFFLSNDSWPLPQMNHEDWAHGSCNISHIGNWSSIHLQGFTQAFVQDSQYGMDDHEPKKHKNPVLTKPT
jgi:hypothetical protein